MSQTDDPDVVEAAAYALYRFDAARHPIKQTTEAAKWQIWDRVAPIYRKRAKLALLAAENDRPPVKPHAAAREGENLALEMPAGFDL